MDVHENNLSFDISSLELEQFIKDKTGKDLENYSLCAVDENDDGIRLEYELN